MNNNKLPSLKTIEREAQHYDETGGCEGPLLPVPKPIDQIAKLALDAQGIELDVLFVEILQDFVDKDAEQYKR
ncbi:MAG: hypothetical protein QFB86_02400 [Patescibacteria group bacterium]|nr:hypothetical protein [Patescibacteria group bacterium]